jgi:hypothetical protein
VLGDAAARGVTPLRAATERALQRIDLVRQHTQFGGAVA